MAGEKKKIEELNDGIGELEGQYAKRTFSYDPEADKGYQDYVAMMQQNGKKAMQDTVGKASALTGGFANSYAVNAGQQAYNDFAKQAADAQPSFRQMARDEYDAETQDILGRLNMMKQQKSDIWDDAALLAGFEDYSGYVEDLGLYSTSEEAQEALSGLSEPTEAQIAYAKEAFKKGEKELDNYVQSLAGVDTDAIYDVIHADTELTKSRDYLESRFKMSDAGGCNWWGGLDHDAALELDGESQTVKEWYEILQKDVKNGGYGFTKDEAKEFLKEIQKKTGVVSR